MHRHHHDVCADFVNLYKIYTDKLIWPRGIPPSHPSIHQTPLLSKGIGLSLSDYAVIQGLVDSDPDVDAHFRLHLAEGPFYFDKNLEKEIILSETAVMPCNTQNTFWIDRKMFYTLYLPTTVSMRCTDILKGFVALFQLWKAGKSIKFTGPTAVQERNEHDLTKDFEQELEMYKTAPDVIRLLNQNRGADMLAMYELLAEHGIVRYEELSVLEERLRLVREYGF